MGNRGRLIDKKGNLCRPFEHNGWICCATKWGNRRVPLWEPEHYTPLFFLDEAVAMVAGHRPCALCRREAYVQFKKAWPGNAAALATEINRKLHKERVHPGTKEQIRHTAEFDDLPSGTFVAMDDEAWLVRDSSLARYARCCYDKWVPRPSGRAVVLTPPSIVEALKAGYSPDIHPSAGVNP